MENLRAYVKEGNVRAKAMVYIRTNEDKEADGMACFKRDMRGLGAPEDCLVFVTNEAKTDALRPYTGEVTFNGDMPQEVKNEVLPLILARRSMPTRGAQGVHVYNNPLFRTVVSMGCWGNPGCDYDPYEDSYRNIKAVKEYGTYIEGLRRAGFDVSFVSVLQDLIEAEAAVHAEIRRMERLKSAMKRGGFAESAKGYTASIRAEKQRLAKVRQDMDGILEEIQG